MLTAWWKSAAPTSEESTVNKPTKPLKIYFWKVCKKSMKRRGLSKRTPDSVRKWKLVRKMIHPRKSKLIKMMDKLLPMNLWTRHQVDMATNTSAAIVTKKIGGSARPDKVKKYNWPMLETTLQKYTMVFSKWGPFTPIIYRHRDKSSVKSDRQTKKVNPTLSNRRSQTSLAMTVGTHTDEWLISSFENEEVQHDKIIILNRQPQVDSIEP